MHRNIQLRSSLLLFELSFHLKFLFVFGTASQLQLLDNLRRRNVQGLPQQVGKQNAKQTPSHKDQVV
jgi:hypothetical protein